RGLEIGGTRRRRQPSRPGAQAGIADVRGGAKAVPRSAAAGLPAPPRASAEGAAGGGGDRPDAGGVMSGARRPPCRHPPCRVKLREPVENEHHAFCARGCFESFYRALCLVCEEQMRRKTERQRIKSGHKKCEAEYRKFPHAFSYPPSRAQISDESLGSAHST